MGCVDQAHGTRIGMILETTPGPQKNGASGEGTRQQADDFFVEGLLSDRRVVGHAEGSRKGQVRIPFSPRLRHVSRREHDPLVTHW